MLSIGQRIYLRRKECKLTQADLAKLVGIPQPNLSNIEKDKCDLTVTTLSRIAYALKSQPQDFFEPDGGALKKGVKLTRQKVEELAASAFLSEDPGDPGEKFIVTSIRELLPQTRKSRFPVRALHEIWLRLHDVLADDEIELLLQRVKDEWRRRG